MSKMGFAGICTDLMTADTQGQIYGRRGAINPSDVCVLLVVKRTGVMWGYRTETSRHVVLNRNYKYCTESCDEILTF